MRISNQQIYSGGLNGILDIQRQLVDLQTQISTGKKVDTPADDPVAAAQILSIKRQLSVTGQFNENALVAENRLSLEETTLGSIKNALFRVRELAIQAGDGALSKVERQGVAVEVSQRLQEMLGYINTKDANGQYLFSGFQSNTQPFVENPPGSFTYQGDQGQLFLQVAANVQIAVSDSGRELFEDVDQPLDVSVSNVGNSGSGAVSTQAVINQAELEGFFGGDAAEIEFSVVGPATTYTVRRVSDNSVISGGDPLAPLANIPYVAGEPIVFEGLHLEITGAPDNGDTFTVTANPPAKLGLLDIVENLATGLESLGDTTQDQVRLEELIADTLIGLDSSLQNISQTEAKVGARLNAAEDAVVANEDIELFSRQVLSELEDLDLTEAISNLTFQSTILEAAQGSYVRVNNLSLFNFLR